MAETLPVLTKDEVPPIIWPLRKKFDLNDIPGIDPSKMKPDSNPPLPVEIVDDWNWWALFANLITAVLIFLGIGATVLYCVTKKRIGSPSWAIVIPLIVIWVLIVFFYDYLMADVDTQKGEVRLDRWKSDTMTVFLQGGHFTPWWFAIQADYALDFKKHSVVVANSEAKTQVEFQVKNGYTMFGEFTCLFETRNDVDGLGRRLRFTEDEIMLVLRALIKSYLSNLGGSNTYETISAYKAEITNWIASIFGGKEFLSEFEQLTGIRIMDPVLDTIDLTAESKTAYLAKSKKALVVETVSELKTAGITDPDKALRTAELVAGLIKQEVTTQEIKVVGLPPNAKTVVLGEARVSV